MKTTRFPEATATVINLIRHYASGAKPVTGLQRSFAAAMRTSDPTRAISQRMSTRFESARPSAMREAFPGTLLDSAHRAPRDELARVFRQAAVGVALHDDVGRVVTPRFPRGTRFSIFYQGLYCNDRTGDRPIVGPSDEPYVLTNVVSVLDAENVVRSELHPLGDPDQHYGDVDSGESRLGPIGLIWEGPEPTADISVVTTVMENDEGDPDFYQQEVRNAVNAAAAVAAFFNVVVAVAIKAVMEDILLWLIDSADDEIGTAVHVLSPDHLKQAVVRPMSEIREQRVEAKPVGFGFEFVTVTDDTGIDRHFDTRHTDSGKYMVGYRVEANRSPVPVVEEQVDSGQVAKPA